MLAKRAVDEYRLLPRSKRMRASPLWYGLGCWLLVLLALVAYGLSHWVMRLNAQYGWVPLPGPNAFPDWVYRLGISHTTLLLLALTVVLFLLLLGLSSLIYALLLRLFGFPLD